MMTKAQLSPRQFTMRRHHTTRRRVINQSSHSHRTKFLLFSRILMTYLEVKRCTMYSRAKEEMIDCAKKNEHGYPGYSSLSASMQFRLKELVGDVYWKKAEEIMRNYMTRQFIRFESMSVADATIKAKYLARLAASPLPTDARNVDDSSIGSTISSVSTGSMPEVPLYPTDQPSRKELSLIFTKVLMRYLEVKRFTIHSQARDVIINCAKQSRNGNPAFASLCVSTQSHLKQLVGEKHWKKAEELLGDYMTQQFMNNGNKFAFANARKKANAVARSAASPLPFYADLTNIKVPGPSILSKQPKRELGAGKAKTGRAPNRTKFVSFKEEADLEKIDVF